MSDSILPWVVLLPAFFGVVALLIPRRGWLMEIVTVLGAAVVFVLTLVISGQAGEGYTLPIGTGDLGRWIDVRFLVDGLNAWVAPFAAFFTLIVAVWSAIYMRFHPRRPLYYAAMLFTVSSALCALYADGAATFLAAWGVLALLLYVLIGIDGERAGKAARKSFIIIGGADFLTVLGVVLLLHLAGKASFSAIQASRIPATGLGAVALVLVLIGALAKAGAMPFHTWIPDAATVSPAPVLAYLPASLDKLLGIYLLARASIYLFELSYGIGLLLMIVGAVTIVAGVTAAMLQKDLKRLLSFNAVGQVGYMVLGVGTGVPIGVAGGIFHMLNHALYECCFFLCSGNVEHRTRTTDLDKLGGLARFMPWTFGATLVAALAVSGIPPLNGFFSKWMVYQGTIESATWTPYGVEGAVGVANPLWWVFLTAAMFGGALTMATFIKVLYSVFLGAKPDALGEPKAVTWPMAVPVLVLAFLCVAFGILATVPVGWIQSALPQGHELFTSIGLWSPRLGAGLLILSLLIGAILYWLSSKSWEQEAEVFVGGESMGDDESRVLSSQFYSPVKHLRFLKVLQKQAGRGAFDIYEQLRHGGGAFVQAFRRLHTGILTTYLYWIALGIVLLLFAMIGG